ncbi:universal stress protein [Vulcanisaeta thermophila]|uniref:universal stress protein n=1 Tax=Vulcanisaeta thermophila TaxID=867917 RepID=UPI0009FD6297|nr:universal stress protein [Vulcanisaeta thermophila]
MPTIERILVGYDGSVAGAKALSYAIMLAKNFRAKLYILHVIEAGKLAVTTEVSMYPSIIESLERSGREILTRAVDEARNAGVDVEGLLEMGSDAAETIINTADRVNADLIVVGSRGLKGLTRFLLGSVSEKVVRYANRPVLVVH